jgi:hypothetical protein
MAIVAAAASVVVIEPIMLRATLFELFVLLFDIC